MPLITCEKLNFKYDTNPVLTDVNFKLNKGDYLCIIGENGSGKTTLINSILNIIKPQSGNIKFYDNLTFKSIGYLPQKSDIQKKFPASVFEVVASGCINKNKLFPFYTKKQKEIAKRNIELLNISNIINKCFNELSGGQQQRVLLARALCATEKLLILDEPVTGLDPVATEYMYETISHLNKNHGISVILVSHDIKKIINNATHILHLDNKVLFYGTVNEYLKTDLLKKLTEN